MLKLCFHCFQGLFIGLKETFLGMSVTVNILIWLWLALLSERTDSAQVLLGGRIVLPVLNKLGSLVFPSYFVTLSGTRKLMLFPSLLYLYKASCLLLKWEVAEGCL